MPPDPTPDPPPAPTYFEDCCLEVLLPADATPVLVIGDDDVDPFTGKTGSYPSPIIYWSNGTITAGPTTALR